MTGVSTLTGFPEMMDGRVKTLHPAIHGGILARRDRADDLAGLERLGIGLVDLVVVNLYPFAAAAANPATPFDALVEEIDIGGPSLVRAAAKNFRDVLVTVDPADYPRVLAALDDTPSLAFRFDLARKAIAHTAAYDAAIAAHAGDRAAGRRRVRTRWCLRGRDRSARAWTCRSRRSAICGTAKTRTSAPPGIQVSRPASRPASAGRRFSRARSCRTRTCSISTPRCESCSSSTSPPRLS